MGAISAKPNQCLCLLLEDRNFYNQSNSLFIAGPLARVILLSMVSTSNHEDASFALYEHT